VSTIRSWRLVKTRYVRHAFDGEGARLYGGRWSSPGLAAVYTSATASLAVLEVFANAQRRAELLSRFQLLSCTFEESLVTRIERNELPSNWRQSPAPPRLQEIGDDWLRFATTVVLEVPSSIIEHESNYLLNPRHRDFKHVKRSAPEPFVIDLRLIKDA
jgi:RES domain-containing protein